MSASVAVQTTCQGGKGFSFSGRLNEATLLFLRSQPEPQSVTVDNQLAKSTTWNIHGFEFDAVTTDLTGEVRVQIA